MTDLFLTHDGVIKVAKQVGAPPFVDFTQFKQVFVSLALISGNFDISSFPAVLIMSGGRIPKQMRQVRRLPKENTVATIFVNGGDSGRHTITSTGNFGVIEIIHYDADNRPISQKYVANARIRDESGVDKISISIEVGERLTLSFFAGFKSDILWSGAESFIQYNNATDEPVIEIEGTNIGSSIINVTGLFALFDAVNINVIAAP